MKCAACLREAAGRYCSRHEQALEQLRAHHQVWVRAYGQIEWSDYLARLAKMQETGQWAKEVIESELKK